MSIVYDVFLSRSYREEDDHCLQVSRCMIRLEKNTKQTAEEAKAKVGDDEAEVTEQTSEKETKAGEEEAEHGGDGEYHCTEKLTIRGNAVRDGSCILYVKCTYPTSTKSALISRTARNGLANRTARTAAKAVKTSCKTKTIPMSETSDEKVEVLDLHE